MLVVPRRVTATSSVSSSSKCARAAAVPRTYPSEVTKYPESPREAARRFTPELTALVNNPLYSDVWTDGRLSPRDRSIATLAALTVLYRPDELPAPLRRAVDNGLKHDEISALITHVAFYGGFPAAISASMIAAVLLVGDEGVRPPPGRSEWAACA